MATLKKNCEEHIFNRVSLTNNTRNGAYTTITLAQIVQVCCSVVPLNLLPLYPSLFYLACEYALGVFYLTILLF